MNWTKFVACILLALVFIFRIFNFSEIQFDSDFGRDVLFAHRIIHEKLTLLGAQASVGGFYLGPLYFYTIALIFFFFGPVPEIIMLFFAFLNVAAAWIGWRLLSRHVDSKAGLVFLALFAFNPLLIAASRGATHMPMMAIITVLVIALLTRAIQSEKKWLHFLSGLALGLYLHVHFSAFLMFPGYFLAILLFSKGSYLNRLKLVLIHILALVVMAAPLLVFDFRHGFITSSAFFKYILASASGGAIRDAFPHWSTSQKISALSSFITFAGWAKVFILAGASAGLLLLGRLKKRNLTASVVGLMFFSTLLMLIAYRGYLFTYYLVIPGVILLLFVSILVSRLKAWLAMVVVAVIIIGNISQLPPLYSRQFRTIPNLIKITSLIERNQQHLMKPKFAVFKDSADGLTGLAYEYRFLLTRSGSIPVSEYTYDQAEVLYVIREDGQSDPLKLGNYEITQFKPRASKLLGEISIEGKKISVFELSK